MIEKHAGVDRMGSFRGAYRYGNRERAAQALARDLKPMVLGEPSPAFYPPDGQEVGVSGDVFLETIQRRSKDPETATATDVQNRITQQNERCIELLHYGGWNAGNLPESWRRYLVKHWEEINVLIGLRSLSSAESSLSF